MSCVVSGCSDDGGSDEDNGGDSSTAGTKNTAGTGGTKNTGGSDSNGGADSNNGGSDSAGENSGGTAPSAGTGAGGDSGGSAGGGGGDEAGGGGGGGAAGLAVAKFCNTLTFGTEQDPEITTFRLDIGVGAEKVSFTADSFECTPIVNTDCTPIPLGDQPYELFDMADDSAPVDSGTVQLIEDGDEWFFLTDLSDDDEPSPILGGGVDGSGTLVCKTADYEEILE
jgi:hypothetical protein